MSLWEIHEYDKAGNLIEVTKAVDGASLQNTVEMFGYEKPDSIFDVVSEDSLNKNMTGINFQVEEQ